MSKPNHDSWPSPSSPSERIPTYEESVAAASTSPRPQATPSSQEKHLHSVPSMIRQERVRRIQHLVTAYILPTFTLHLSNHACSHLTIVIVPSGSLQNCGQLQRENIVMPSLQPPETTGVVLALEGEEDRASFWIQNAVIQELDAVLRRELSGSSVHFPAGAEEKGPSLQQFQVQPPPTAALPLRPRQKSWLKRTFVLPGPDHDPTGETGKWDLGWRSTKSSSTGGAGSANDASETPSTRTRTLRQDEVAVHTRLQDVSFRTESELGLLETTTVKCIWVQIEVGI